jgi:transcription initiation factor TFIID subunit 9B
MASPAPDAANGISTPPGTTTNGHAASPPQSTAPASQPAQPATTTTAAAAAAAPTTSYPSTSLTDAGTSKRPRDARLIHLLLANMGVHAYTERVPLQLLDFAYRYTSSILSDALAYEPPVPTHTTAAKKRDAAAETEGVSLNALRTAVQGRATQQFQHALGKEFMADLAAERNRIALPRVDREFGLRLPPERYCFTGVGWQVRGAWEDEVGSEAEAEGDGGEDEDMDGELTVAGQQGAGADAVEVERAQVKDEDTEMGGMDEVDEDEFEEAMGTG